MPAFVTVTELTNGVWLQDTNTKEKFTVFKNSGDFCTGKLTSDSLSSMFPLKTNS